MRLSANLAIEHTKLFSSRTSLISFGKRAGSWTRLISAYFCLITILTLSTLQSSPARAADWDWDSVSNYDYCRAVVIAIKDAKTLKLRFVLRRDISAADQADCPQQGTTEEFRLNGVWSDPKTEPATGLARRTESMRRLLLGKSIYLPLFVQVVTDKGEVMNSWARLKDPTDAKFKNNTSVNAKLFRLGLALLDEEPFSDSRAVEHHKEYSKAEDDGISGRRGIWATDTAGLYLKFRNKMLRDASRAWDGMGFFFGIQVLQMVAVIWLMLLVSEDSLTVKATALLLLLPLANLLPDIWLWMQAQGNPVDQINPGKAQEFQMLFPITATIIVFIAAIAFVVLIVIGPAGIWGGAGAVFGRPNAIITFFAGIWVLIFLFAGAFVLNGAPTSWPQAFVLSRSLALGLPLGGSLHHSSWLELGEQIAFWVWVWLFGGLFGSLIERTPAPVGGTLFRNVSMTFACLLITTIAITSFFSSLMFSLNYHLGDANLVVSRSDFFQVSLATLFRQNYDGIHVHAKWYTNCLIVESHIALFLGLAGFLALSEIPWMREQRRETPVNGSR